MKRTIVDLLWGLWLVYMAMVIYMGDQSIVAGVGVGRTCDLFMYCKPSCVPSGNEHREARMLRPSEELDVSADASGSREVCKNCDIANRSSSLAVAFIIKLEDTTMACVSEATVRDMTDIEAAWIICRAFPRVSIWTRRNPCLNIYFLERALSIARVKCDSRELGECVKWARSMVKKDKKRY